MDQQREKLLQIARALLGAPYKYAAKPEDIPTYLDCSSFTQYAYQQIGVDIPRSTILQAAHAGTEIQLTTHNLQSTTTLKPGDLIFFRGSKGHYDDKLFPGREIYIGHVAMYTNDNNALHASSPQGVIEQTIQDIIKERGSIIIVKRLL